MNEIFNLTGEAGDSLAGHQTQRHRCHTEAPEASIEEALSKGIELQELQTGFVVPPLSATFRAYQGPGGEEADEGTARAQMKECRLRSFVHSWQCLMTTSPCNVIEKCVHCFFCTLPLYWSFWFLWFFSLRSDECAYTLTSCSSGNLLLTFGSYKNTLGPDICCSASRYQPRSRPPRP